MSEQVAITKEDLLPLLIKANATRAVADHISLILAAYGSNISDETYEYVYNLYQAEVEDKLVTFIHNLTYFPQYLAERILTEDSPNAKAILHNKKICSANTITDNLTHIHLNNWNTIFQRNDLTQEIIDYAIDYVKDLRISLVVNNQLSSHQIIKLIHKIESGPMRDQWLSAIFLYQQNIPKEVLIGFYEEFQKKNDQRMIASIFHCSIFPREHILSLIKEQSLTQQNINILAEYNKTLVKDDFDKIVLNQIGGQNIDKNTLLRIASKQTLSPNVYQKLLSKLWGNTTDSYFKLRNARSLIQNPQISPECLHILIKELDYCNKNFKDLASLLASQELSNVIIKDIFNHNAIVLQRAIAPQLKKLPIEDLAQIYNNTSSKYIKESIIGHLSQTEVIRSYLKNMSFVKISPDKGSKINAKMYDSYFKKVANMGINKTQPEIS